MLDPTLIFYEVAMYKKKLFVNKKKILQIFDDKIIYFTNKVFLFFLQQSKLLFLNYAI